MSTKPIFPVSAGSVKQGTFLSLTVLIMLLFMSADMRAQGPGSLFVDAGPDVTLDCDGGGSVDLTASFLETFSTADNSYTIESIDYNPPFPFDGLSNSLNPNIDDAWSPVDVLPFDFCYFENIETQFQVGSNGVIRFDVDPNDTTNGWSFDEDLPNNSNPTLGEANVFTPGHDIDPSASSTEEIAYEVLGDFPNRVLVVSYFEVPMFSGACNNLLATQMVVFYEFSNVIEVYLQDKPACPSWNDGNAVLGIQNNDGDIAFVPSGRNTSDSPWETNNEAWQFNPAGEVTFVFEWLDETGAVVGTDPVLNVSPAATTTYTAKTTYSNCTGDLVILEDEVVVTVSGGFSVDLQEDQVFCGVESYEIVPELGGNTTGATYLWSTGETTPTITVSNTDVYSVDVTVEDCTITDSIQLTFLEFPDCEVEPVCTQVDFNEDFGTGAGRVCDLNGASTTYLCNDVSQIEDGEYSISNTSDGLNTGWHQGMQDHTEGDADGRMLFVNADFNPGEFYRNTITLTENIDYTFSAWITTVYDTDSGICGGTGIPSNVIFRIEDLGGATIAETNTGDIQNQSEPNWQQFFINFNTGANTDVQLVLINNSIGGCGNDLAIDDITLSLENLEPQILAPADLTACDETGTGNATFELTTVIDTVLDGQDPANFNVSFHLTEFDAQSDQNEINNASAYENEANPETIFVRVDRANEETCFSTVTFDLIVDQVVDFDTTLPENTVVCSSDDIPTWDATPTNDGLDLSLVTYEWADDDGNLVGTEATFTPSAAGDYTVALTYPNCSLEAFSVSLSITELLTVDLGADQTLCDGGVIELIPTITGGSEDISFEWSTGDTTETLIVDTTGVYTLTVTDGPCVASDTIEVFIADPVVVDAGADFKTCPDEPQQITAVTNAPEPTFQWFLNGDVITGETGSSLEITLDGDSFGTQTYLVLVTAGGCTGEDSVDVTPYEVGNCVISQGISPNGDGFNDILDLEFLSDRTGGINKLQVYNRLGTLVFEQSNYVNEWAGQDKNGNELPTGTYFYVMDFLNEDAVYGAQATGWIYLNKEAN